MSADSYSLHKKLKVYSNILDVALERCSGAFLISLLILNHDVSLRLPQFFYRLDEFSGLHQGLGDHDFCFDVLALSFLVFKILAEIEERHQR